jgi:hypothetical protein
MADVKNAHERFLQTVAEEGPPPKHVVDIAEAKRRNERAGGSWFSDREMHRFGTVIENQTLYGNRYFATGEDHHDGRRWTVRRLEDDGRITTVGEFGQYATRKGAMKAAQMYAAEAGSA